jgi:glutathione synthase/RimK-type ligase-like ATP-grasp enzyme
MLTSGRLSWHHGRPDATILGDYFGQLTHVSELDAIWWRRVNQPQARVDELPDIVTRDLVQHEWRAAIFGVALDVFGGTWINDPSKDVIAGNKICHLAAAAKAGFLTPRTLVSQEPKDVREFCDEVGGRVIVKKLMGTTLRPMATVLLSRDDLEDDASIRLCPSIYQEPVSTTRHLRVCCFGREVFAILITSPVLDWRRDLAVPFSAYKLDRQIETRLVELINSLGLRMGIMDMMIDSADRLVWLELNTQGQFLFAEAKSGLDLTTPFVDFLIDESRRSS